MATKFYIYNKETGVVAMIADSKGNIFDIDKFEELEADEAIEQEYKKEGDCLTYNKEEKTIEVNS